MNILKHKPSVEELYARLSTLESRVSLLERETHIAVEKNPGVQMVTWDIDRYYYKISTYTAIWLILQKLGIELKYTAGTPETIILVDKEANK